METTSRPPNDVDSDAESETGALARLRREVAAHSSVDDLLTWVAARFERPVLACAFNPEDCLLVSRVAATGASIAVMSLDTGLLFEETYALWRTLERRYDLTIEAVRPDRSVAQQARDEGDALWSRQPNRCCHLRKVAPLERRLRQADVWITGIRRAQTPQRATAERLEFDARFDLYKVNPLAFYSTEDVAREIREGDVPTNPLHAEGFPSIGCAPCTARVAPGEDPRAGRWRASAKTECGLHWPTRGGSPS